jgi:hypothetical protein
MEKREWSDLFTADLSVADPEIARLIAAQERQNRTTVNLVASETYCPAATLAAETSELVNKNDGGYTPRVSFNGGATIDAIERLALPLSVPRGFSGRSTPTSNRCLRPSPISPCCGHCCSRATG